MMPVGGRVTMVSQVEWDDDEHDDDEDDGEHDDVHHFEHDYEQECAIKFDDVRDEQTEHVESLNDDMHNHVYHRIN